MGLLIRQLFDFISRSTVQPLRREAMELPRMLNDADAVIRFNGSKFFALILSSRAKNNPKVRRTP